jgi:REP element-mobilizing transposase RayT
MPHHSTGAPLQQPWLGIFARRQDALMPNKRMFAHDYTRAGFYMITLVTAGRRPLFGACREDRVQLSAAGEAAQRRWLEIPVHRPAIETNTLVVMPDHLHGIVYVKEPLPKPVGLTIRGYKSGVTSELRRLLKDPGLQVWEDGYHDRVVMCSETLQAERHYIRDNPRRYCLRKAHPDLFVRVNRLDNPRLPVGADWAGYGNLFLLDKPALLPVQVSRSVAADELDALKAAVAEQTTAGAVMVSPFLSPGEKAIAGLVMERDYGSLILLKPDGFPPLYKPAGAYFDLCAQGRLLVLAPFAYMGRRQPLTRECCLQMNEWVKELCGKNAAPP